MSNGLGMARLWQEATNYYMLFSISKHKQHTISITEISSMITCIHEINKNMATAGT